LTPDEVLRGAPFGYLACLASRPSEVSDLLPLLDTQNMSIPDCLAVLSACDRCRSGDDASAPTSRASTARGGEAEADAGPDDHRKKRAAAAMERYEAMKRRSTQS